MEDMQKEGEFFQSSDLKLYSLTCFTGDLTMNEKGFALRAGYGLCYHPDMEDPVYLQTARGGMRIFKTADAAVNLLLSNGVGRVDFYFDQR